MANVCCPHHFDIDYSVVDGRVRSFSVRDLVLYDEDSGVVVDGWRDDLVAVVRAYGLDVDEGRGKHAFVLRLEKDGLL